MTRAGSAVAARPAHQQARGGAIPTPALHSLRVESIATRVARSIVERFHYLHSMPGGTKLAFGVMVGRSLMGVVTVGVGPMNAHRLVNGLDRNDMATLTRLWLSDDLPTNSESRVIGVVVRALRKHTSLRALISYADPSHGHVGTIYQAAGWLYTGTCQATSLIDIGDGKLHHSRSIGHAYGTHSVRHFRSHGLNATTVPQTAKHRYIKLLDRSLSGQVNVPLLPYPKKGDM